MMKISSYSCMCLTTKGVEGFGSCDQRTPATPRNGNSVSQNRVRDGDEPPFKSCSAPNPGTMHPMIVTIQANSHLPAEPSRRGR